MRNLGEVIDSMLAVIPANEVDLIADLNKAKDSFMYTSPETIGTRWEEAAYALGYRFAHYEYAQGTWEDAVIRIWMGN